MARSCHVEVRRQKRSPFMVSPIHIGAVRVRDLAALLALAGVLFVAASVRAELVAIDPTATLDSDTGLQWLRVTETAGVSVTDIDAGAGGYLQAGWRHATVAEVCALFETYLVPVYVPPEPCPSSEVDFPIFSTPASVLNWLALLGNTGFDFGPFGSGTNALLETASGSLRRGIVVYGSDALYAVQLAGIDPDSSDPNVGHFLVRKTEAFAVPATSNAGLVLLAVALMVVGAVVRNKDVSAIGQHDRELAHS